MVDVWMLDVHVSELPIGFQTVNLAPCYPSELKPGHQPICAPSEGVSRGYGLGCLQFRLPRRGSYRHGNHNTLHTYTYHPIWCCLVSLHTHTHPHKQSKKLLLFSLHSSIKAHLEHLNVVSFCSVIHVHSQATSQPC